MDSNLTAALVPLILLVVGFVAYCLWDVARVPEVRYLPRWTWALLVVVSVPFGGIAYLLLGRSRS